MSTRPLLILSLLASTSAVAAPTIDPAFGDHAVVQRGAPLTVRGTAAAGEQESVDAQCLKGRLVPEVVAALGLFLASDDARLLTGHDYFVDAGWR